MELKGISPHGGDLHKAEELYGIRKEDYLDFSANINPLGVPSGLRELIISRIDSLVNYPDPEYAALRKSVADYIESSNERIIAGNGASEIIFLLFEVLKPACVLMPAPTFSEYALAAKRAGSEVRYFRLDEKDGFELDMDSLINEIESGAECEIVHDNLNGTGNRIDAVILCNPNNPTSKLVKKDDILRFLIYAEKRGIQVIIDEAFIELTEGMNDNSVVQYSERFDNLFIIRAFTKLFAVPGLRLGYGIGNPGLIEEMQKRKTPWSVNTFAACIGEYLEGAGEYLEKTSAWFSEERRFLYGELKKLPKIKVYEPQTNFILVKLIEEGLTSGALKHIMAGKGILIRDASNFEFLDNHYIRLAVKDRTSNIRLLAVLEEVLAERII